MIGFGFRYCRKHQMIFNHNAKIKGPYALAFKIVSPQLTVPVASLRAPGSIGGAGDGYDEGQNVVRGHVPTPIPTIAVAVTTKDRTWCVVIYQHPSRLNARKGL